MLAGPARLPRNCGPDSGRIEKERCGAGARAVLVIICIYYGGAFVKGFCVPPRYFFEATINSG
jgi:hypothetical protein